VLRHVPNRARILEIGAGEGLLAARLAAAGHDVVALDTQLRSMFAIVECSFEDYDAPPHSFDCVVAQLVLHHAPDLNTTLDKTAGLLAAGGLIAIDDYGWERSSNEAFREQRSDLLTSDLMLPALRRRFTQVFYEDHANVSDGTDNDRLGFTFVGRLLLQK
jgi:SAM-dependent methyltransferase